eukprot:4972952-Prymnesium_polylepis.3
MAIPEKRTLGTWCKWLGILIIASIGVVVVPKDKLLRAAKAIEQTLDGGVEFHVCAWPPPWSPSSRRSRRPSASTTRTSSRSWTASASRSARSASTSTRTAATPSYMRR